MKNKKVSKVIITVFSALFLFLGLITFFSAKWYLKIYGNVGFDSVLYTLSVSFEGVEGGLVIKYLTGAFLPAVLVFLPLFFVLFPPIKRKFKFYPINKWISLILSFSLCFGLVYSSANEAGAIEYISAMGTETSAFIEENYVNPENVKITFPENKRNLIYIYLESMETAFFSQEDGGGNDTNVIPNLYSLAQNNLNFSHNGGVGGFSSLSGSTWTIGSMVATTSGLPLKTPFGIDANTYNQGSFLPGVTSLNDILHQNGYYQTLMVGSDSSYGGRKQYFEGHGVDKVYDLFSARADGIVPSDYHVWWGMEDKHLYNYAKQELTKIAQSEQPFAFTMLTVDTHHIAGYVCELCENKYDEQYENVLSCADKQIIEFINWIKAQDFYENTTIIVTGDHPTMDGEYISRNVGGDYVRKVYNCFINTKAEAKKVKGREFCSMDMFPTILGAIGCEIEGEKLGLGTNLFSATPTLCETLGTNTVNHEVSKNSEYYNKEFLMLFKKR